MTLKFSATVRECPDCGLFQGVSMPPMGHAAVCQRCGSVLWRRRSDPTERSLAMGTVALICYLLLVSTPLLGVDVAGRQLFSRISSLPEGFEQHGMPLLALLVLGTIIAAPVVRIALTITVLGSVQQGVARPALMARLTRLRAVLGPWSMLDVFLLGVFVAYTRIGALAPAQPGVAIFALGALVFAKIAGEMLLDEHTLWERIRPSPAPPMTLTGRRPISCTSCGVLAPAEDEGHACPRCGAALHRRRPYSLARTWAYLIAAAALYAPANFLPIMTYTRYARSNDYTILGGVQELLTAGQWPLALLVFVASVCVPVLKIIGLLVLLISTHRGAPGYLRDRTYLYRIIEVIGRWSMIDIFMVSILTALVQMGQLANVIPRAGAVCFAAVVVLTMLSAASFDPRLMWDAASARRGTSVLQGERRLA